MGPARPRCCGRSAACSTATTRASPGATIRRGGGLSTDPDPSAVVASGIAHVMEGRRVFGELSVRDNLVAGGYLLKRRAAFNAAIAEVLELFPRLADRLDRPAGLLSGGEQQMLAIGRALMQRPRLLLLDEPSLGLAPMIVEQIMTVVRGVNERSGTSILLVEQNAAMALDVAHYGYVLANGRVVVEGTPDELREDRDVGELFLGVRDGGQRSYRDAKAYHRRARWAS